MIDDRDIEIALEVIERFGMIPELHHKQWVLDQVVRALLRHRYKSWREQVDERRRKTGHESWDEGIAP